MKRIDTDDLEPKEQPLNRHSISDSLDAEDFSMNYYTLEPGEEFSGGLHTHMDQEESFFVLEGEATFETKPEPTADSETVTIGDGQMVRFDPGEYQQGRNESDETLRALALGTPAGSTDVRVATPCGDCGESDYLEFTMVEGEPAVVCPECEAEFEA